MAQVEYDITHTLEIIKSYATIVVRRNEATLAATEQLKLKGEQISNA